MGTNLKHREDESGKAVLIHIETGGNDAIPLQDRIQIDDSTAGDIVVCITDCESLRIEFNQARETGRAGNGKAFLTVSDTDDDSALGVKRPASLREQNKGADADASAAASDGDDDANGKSVVHLSMAARNLSSTDDENISAGSAVAAPDTLTVPALQDVQESSAETDICETASERISSDNVPMARVRWSSIPPSPELLYKQNNYMAYRHPVPSPYESFGDVDIPIELVEMSPRLSDTTLQIVKTSFPPPDDAELARRRKPIFWVSAAAILVLAGVVGVASLMFPDVINRYGTVTPTSGSTSTVVKTADTPAPQSVPLLTTSVDAISVVQQPSNEQVVQQSHQQSHRRRERAEHIAAVTPSPASDIQRKPVETRRRNVEHFTRSPLGVASVRPDVAVVPSEPSVPIASVREKNKKIKSALSGPVPANPHDRPRQMGTLDANTGNTGQTESVIPQKVIESSPPKVNSATRTQPSRDTVKKVMAEIAPYVAHCRLSRTGRVVLEMVVDGPSGQVVSAKAVDDTFKGTATGLCAAKVVRGAVLPPFAKDHMTIIYPFEI